MMQFTIVTVVFALLASLVWYYSQRQTPEQKKRAQCCDWLDEMNGGSWFYNPSNDHYEDIMTDRRLPAKDVE